MWAPKWLSKTWRAGIQSNGQDISRKRLKSIVNCYVYLMITMRQVSTDANAKVPQWLLNSMQLHTPEENYATNRNRDAHCLGPWWFPARQRRGSRGGKFSGPVLQSTSHCLYSWDSQSTKEQVVQNTHFSCMKFMFPIVAFFWKFHFNNFKSWQRHCLPNYLY